MENKIQPLITQNSKYPGYNPKLLFVRKIREDLNWELSHSVFKALI